MSARVASIVADLGRPPLIGEYPYYRAAPSAWEDNLRELKRNGVDVVSFYVPWRFHEVPGLEAHGTASRFFDFNGATDPQRNLRGLLRLIQAAGLKALVKPGPFIHAEVQLGGLPDRLCEPGRHCAANGLSGRPLLSQGKPLPSLFDPEVRQQVAGWLAAVDEQIVRPFGGADGPIVAVQIGNEGIYSEAGLPLERLDASAPAITAFWAWMQARGSDPTDPGPRGLERCTQDEAVRRLRQEWPRWSGHALVEHWRWLAGFHDATRPTLVNVPLVRLDAPGNAFAGWMARHLALRDSGHRIGHTEWIGNAASDRVAFMSHVLGIQAGHTDTLEANWGFTWSDASFAEPRVPLFHALLGLMLGSTACSVYTACSTRTWSGEIDLDPQGLRADGLDPSLYGPPYCPGAPLREEGESSPNALALQRLAAFLGRAGTDLLNTRLVTVASLRLSKRAILDAAVGSTRRPWLDALLAALEDLLFQQGVSLDIVLGDEAEPLSPNVLCLEGQPGDDDRLYRHVSEALAQQPTPRVRCHDRSGATALLTRQSPDGRILFLGLFNPGKTVDRVSLRTPEGETTLDLAPGGACVRVYRDGRLYETVETADLDGYSNRRGAP